MSAFQDPNKKPQKDSLVKSQFAPSLSNVLYYETQRVKKLTTALYLVTELLEENEPLRRHIRQYATDLLKTTHTPYNVSEEELDFRMSFIVSYMETLMSFIETAHVAKIISAMNADLLLRELRALTLHVSHRYHAFLEAQQTIRQEDHVDLQSVLGNYGTQKNNKENEVSELEDQPHLQQSSVTPTHAQATSSSLPKRSTAEEKKERKKQILDVIRQKNSATIKDIASHIRGCSEKTLQRDLKDLVSKGEIVKEGSRRWSRYRIQNT